MTHLQEGGTGEEVSEILFFSAKSKRRPSLIYSMQIIPVCLSIVARRKGVSATRRGGSNWTPISLLVGHPCKLFHSVDKIPSDTQVRERLDDVDPRSMRPAFKNPVSGMQRGKVLENWTVLGGHYLIAIDGTGIRSSHKVKCEKCCVKNHRNGSTTYFHQMLGAAMIHPDHSVVLPLAPEPIRKEDGAKKNDCERNAAKRLLDDLRRDHPRLKAIIVEDALASNAPHITYLKNKGFRYILGAKPGDHKLLFSRFEASESKKSWKTRDKKTGAVHHFEWDIGLPLNNANSDLKVNMLKYEETDKKGNTKKFSWVTDLPLNRKTVMPVMCAGRRRRAIENETFNALKRRNEYNIEHNYGHGKNHLADVLPTLTMLAFLIDQVQLLCCGLFQKARDYQKRKSNYSGSGFTQAASIIRMS